MVAEPVGGPVEGDDDGAAEEPVEHRVGGPVRSDHDRCLHVALVDDLQQCRGRFVWQRKIPQLVDLCRYRHSRAVHRAQRYRVPGNMLPTRRIPSSATRQPKVNARRNDPSVDGA